MSRYRRRATSVAADNDATQAMNSAPNNTPPVPDIPSLLKTACPPTMTVGESSLPRQSRHATQQRTTGQTIDDRHHQSNIISDGSRNQIPVASRSTQHRSLEQRDASWEAERDRLLEEQKMKDLQRLEEQLENSQRAKTQSHKFRSPVVDKFMFLAKGSKNNKDEMPPASPAATSAKSSTRRSDHEPVRNPPTHIEPGGKGIVPQTDAPTSAINAGDRSVVVRCRHNTFSLPVTPDTTTVDIIAQTSIMMGCDPGIGAEESLVIEQYSTLGLERRLRRYERIRDVMNSWDGDGQNRLAVTLPDTNDSHEDLDIGAVVDGEDAPPGYQLYMYHSNRPGKWNKRWITLLESGQIVCAKKPNTKTTDKDTTSLCHLSDYDIYTPTESQMRRHIKPPKRFCFAIKSQHKTTLFLNKDNYVQYFSTDDPKVAHEFRQKAHGWRSWYVVSCIPDVRRNRTNSVPRTEGKPTAQSPPTKPTGRKPDNIASMDESPYAIGQFEPLLDMKRFDKRLSQFGKDVLPPESDHPKQKMNQTISRRLSKRERLDYKPPQASKRESEEGFTGGLLGEEYENRKQALVDVEKKKRPQDLVFTEGPSLLNSQQDPELSTAQPESPSWFPSAIEHTAKHRVTPQTTAVRSTNIAGAASGRHFSLNSATQRPTGLGSTAARPSTQHRSQQPYSHTHPQPYPNPLGSQPTTLSHLDRRVPPKPLVDLTPTIQEPPQWSKEKKGHGVKPPDDIGLLIDYISVGNGTDGKPNGYLEPPPRTMPRRPNTSGSAGRTRSMSSASPGTRLLDTAPPVPLLPSRLGLENDGSGRRPTNAPDGKIDRRETARHNEREQERVRPREREREQRDREYREREAAYNAVPGRTGTLKVV
ncbi:hypothetical protein E0Z10_g7948 [Xylaria hypoxylon]|uniref:PH domain-containing protein n=1 Tax=Xylaria hypoxylon TaxID=37992 RepID=A0A4Z0YQS0_9PEZI|nr:hypothetical protein E0Z10_g7948 [Xylaria hypoxylon]